MRDPLSGIKRIVSGYTLLLLKDYVFLDQIVDITHDPLNITVYFKGFLARNVILLRI
jgi:hypothetical protein